MAGKQGEEVEAVSNYWVYWKIKYYDEFITNENEPSAIESEAFHWKKNQTDACPADPEWQTPFNQLWLGIW